MAAAEAWLEDAALEHASVASFARLSLQLLALGAPASMVAAAHRAALDEVEHARTCFALAAELSDSAGPLGPSPLSLEGVSFDVDLRSFAIGAAAEGCVGETVAALALSRAAASCESPLLAQRLSAMADDELGHASLAWQCLAWASPHLGPSAHDAIAAALAVPHFAVRSVTESDSDAWRALGRLTQTDMDEVLAGARLLVAEAHGRLTEAMVA
jgi:hypothetical protein